MLQEITGVINLLDPDGKGLISFDDFCRGVGQIVDIQQQGKITLYSCLLTVHTWWVFVAELRSDKLLSLCVWLLCFTTLWSTFGMMTIITRVRWGWCAIEYLSWVLGLVPCWCRLLLGVARDFSPQSNFLCSLLVKITNTCYIQTLQLTVCSHMPQLTSVYTLKIPSFGSHILFMVIWTHKSVQYAPGQPLTMAAQMSKELKLVKYTICLQKGTFFHTSIERRMYTVSVTV